VATWIDALASRSGPLLTAAAQFTAAHGLEPDPPRGVPGLRALSGLIRDAQCDDEPDEERFVEGAGAYLGLLLLDHLPAAAHVANAGEHRLRLSPHGFFDPFAAIAGALDATDPPRALLDALKLAEAEAAGSGPTARVVNELLAQLADRSSLRVVQHFDRKLWLDLEGARIELDLERIIEVARGESAALLSHAVSRLCASLTHASTPLLSWETARPQLFPRLVGRKFVDGLPESNDLHLLPLGSEVWETLVLRYRERARYVRRVEVETWSKDGASAKAQALHNLARSYERARFLQHTTEDGPIVIAESRDGLDAARLLLPGLHEVLAPALGSPFIAAIPHRDTLLACPTEPAALVRELERRVDAAVRAAPHAIARTLWLVTGPGQFHPL
ncbi:MAG TPA: hypothetical protein VGI70_05280, partial [Polyangiales bacterium]|jgi:hypothetical protein